MKIIGEVRHWNFPITQFPEAIANPRHLVEQVKRAEHTILHKRISSGSNYWKGPIAPEHQIDVSSTPLIGPPDINKNGK